MTALGNLFAAGWKFLRRTGLYIPLTFLAIMAWRAPHADPHDWDYDEGINLMKVLLVDRGYALYTDIWSDQPPLLTAMLSWWFKPFGPSAASARILILFFSALILWSLYMATRKSVSEFAAAVAMLLLVLSEYYIRLSGAVMVGLPALALASLAAVILVTGQRGWWRIVLSATIMALALQTKLFVAAMGPAVGVYLLFDGRAGEIRLGWFKRFLQVIAWGGVLVTVFLALSLTFQALRPDMLLGTHFGAQTQNQSFFVRESSTFLPNFVKQHVVYLIVASVGVGWAIRRRDLDILFPLTWFGFTWLALMIQRPLWYHHVLLLTLPLAWLCGFGIEVWVRAFQRLGDETMLRNAAWRSGAVLVVTAVVFVAGVLFLPQPFEQRLAVQMSINRPNYIEPAFQHLREDAAGSASEDGQLDFVFTDHPFYAFEAGLPVPPPIAVLSRKTMETGVFTDEALRDVLEAYGPRYVLLERFPNEYSDTFMTLLNQRYELIYDEIEPARYYRIKAEYDDGGSQGETRQ